MTKPDKKIEIMTIFLEIFSEEEELCTSYIEIENY